MVVETIDFYEDEAAELPAPLTLAEVKMLNKAAPFGAEEPPPEEGADGKAKPAEVRPRGRSAWCRRGAERGRCCPRLQRAALPLVSDSTRALAGLPVHGFE